MNQQPASTAVDPPVALTGGLDAQATPAPGAPSQQRPYLKAFGPDIGVIELELSDKTVTIGRAAEADVRLPDPKVSRAHARVTCSEGEYTLEDVGSSGGTTVNRKPIQSHLLAHGDSARIGPYILQYRTHQTLPGAAAAAEQAKRLLHCQFSVLPSGIQLQYRTLETAPDVIFRSGDTLRIGQAGLLIPMATPPGDCACLELGLSWSGGRTKQYLGEIVGVIEEESTHWMCVKLHTVSKDMYRKTVDVGHAGEWVDVVST